MKAIHSTRNLAQVPCYTATLLLAPQSTVLRQEFLLAVIILQPLPTLAALLYLDGGLLLQTSFWDIITSGATVTGLNSSWTINRLGVRGLSHFRRILLRNTSASPITAIGLTKQ